MCCERAVNGKRKPCPGNMAAGAPWLAAGFFEKIWAKGLEQYDELEGIGWEWQSLDGCMVKAPLALESVGKNPTDRGKNGDKAQCSGR